MPTEVNVLISVTISSLMNQVASMTQKKGGMERRAQGGMRGHNTGRTCIGAGGSGKASAKR